MYVIFTVSLNSVEKVLF